MTLFLRHMRRRLWILPAITLALALMLGANGVFQFGGPKSRDTVSYTGHIEMYAFLLPALCCCFILYSRDETEIAVVCGTGPVKLMLCQYAPALIYSYPPAAVFCLVVFGPERRPSLLLSCAVTLAFITSLALLGRLLINSTYFSVVNLMLFHAFFKGRNDQIMTMQIPVENARFDLYITNYLNVRHVLKDGAVWEIPPGTWEFNRLMFAGLAVVMFILCIILVRKERVYQP